MLKHRPAQKNFPILVMFSLVILVCALDAVFWPAAAQDDVPTPTPTTTAGTPATIPELPTVGPISISYPLHGQTLKATVNITGSIALEGWTSFELAFADAASTEPNWFPFATGSNPLAEDGPLAVWDTTTVSDGEYILRLRVSSPAGEQDVFVYGIRIRNYTVDTPQPTSTPTITSTATATATATVTTTFTPLPTSTPFSTPTQLPPNPATLRSDEIVFNFLRGGLFSVMLFGIFGLLLHLRSRRK